MNRVTLIGNLGADPDIHHTQAGDPIASFSLATSDRWKDKNTGEKKERTEWHRVVIFNKHLAKIAGDYLTKGSKVAIEGKLQTRKWTDDDGVERYSTEVTLPMIGGTLEMLGTKGEGGHRPDAPPPGDLDDEIPF